MAGRRFTVGEQRFPDTPEFTGVLRQWRKDGVEVMFSHVWRGYDMLWDEILRDLDWANVADDVERELNEFLEARIRRSMTGYEPFDVQHGKHERESRKPAPAQPPQYDIAFYLRENPRSSLPLEAKVLHTDQELSFYIGDLNEEFLTCRYAPFSTEGAMIGYLLKGSPSKAFAKIERDVPCDLHPHTGFPGRAHRYSDHQRKVEPGKPYPVAFRCHHLILRLT